MYKLFILFILCCCTTLSYGEDDLTLLTKINARNAKIQSVFAEVSNSGDRGGITVRSNGWMIYQKPQSFRMIAYANFTKQLTLDIGSNDNEFWFWSKRERPVVLWYANYRDLDRTSIAGSMNPLWISEVLGINAVPLQVASMHSNERFLYLTEQRKQPNSEDAIKVTTIAKPDGQIVKHTLLDKAYRVIMESYATDHYNIDGAYVASTLQLRWAKERLNVMIVLEKIRVNVKTPFNTYFIRPSINPSKNLAQ